MCRWLILCVLGLAGVLGTSNRASAWWAFGGPYYTSAAFPCVNPPGYYTNLYYYGWMYPWYAYYNYSHGPYNGWWLNGGYATYASCGHNQPHCPIPGYVGGPQYGGPPFYPHCSYGSHAPGPLPPAGAPSNGTHPNGTHPNGTPPVTNGTPSAGTVSITMPPDAKLLFNGTLAEGNGAVRTFQTPPLQPGQDYAYELTAQVVVDGQVRQVTERVIVRAGEETKVTLEPAAVRTASK